MDLIWMYANIAGSFLWNQQWRANRPLRWSKRINDPPIVTDHNNTENYFYTASEIEPLLFLSGSYIARRRDELQQLNIRKVLNATHDIPCMFAANDDVTTEFKEGEEETQDLDQDQHQHQPPLEYMQIKLFDTQEQELSKAQLHSAYEFIQFSLQRRQAVLVHCYMGASRSASLIVYYLCRRHNWTIGKAILHLHAKRPLISINANFIESITTLLSEERQCSPEQVQGDEFHTDFVLT